MIRIRMAEEAIVSHYPEQLMRCPVHLSIGQEAVAVGACAALESKDYAVSTHRAHAHYLAKSGDLKAMIAEIHGKASGCSSGKGGSMHLVDLAANFLGSTPIVGGSLPVAVGAAFATWQQGRNEVTAVFFGEGSTEEGVYSESVNFASLKKLPVVFICENNLYSVYSPLSVRQPEGRDRLVVANALGVPGERGNGNDVEEVNRVISAAVARARRGEGPSFVEFDTYRWREHCGVNYDNNIGYRTEAEFQKWRELDPIDEYSRLLLSEGQVKSTDIDAMRAEIAREIEVAFAEARAAPAPGAGELTNGIYYDAPRD